MKKKYYNVIMIIFVIFAIVSSIYVGFASGNKEEKILADIGTSYACYCNPSASSCNWETSSSSTYSVIHREITDSWTCENFNGQSGVGVELNSCNPGYYWTGTVCAPCKKGTYCQGGVRGYDECPYPYTESKERAEKVEDCFMYVEAGKQVKTSKADKELCGTKEYAPAGRNVKYGEISQCIKCDGTVTANQISCISNNNQCFCDLSETACSWRESGTALYSVYRSDIKTSQECMNLSKTNQSVTNSCDRGYYYNGMSCVLCEEGNFCLGGVSGYTKCPSPYTNSNAGAESVNDCFMYVEAGKQVKEVNGTKTSCANDEYYPLGRNVKYGEASLCIKCVGTSTSDQTSCISEEEGCFCDLSETTCSWKASGTETYPIYRGDIKDAGTCEEISKANPQSIINCNPGFYYQEGVCNPCKEGTYCVGGAKTFERCPTPYSNSNEEAKSIEDCFMYVEAGMEVEVQYADKKECDSGEYFPGTRYIYYGKTSQCLECDGIVDSHKISCNATDSLVPICNSGEYLQDGKCVSCPNGYNNSIKGATSINQCYVNLSGQEITKRYELPTNCPSGTYQAPIMVFYGSMAICSPCQGNTYSNEGMTKCRSCNGSVNMEKTTCDSKVESCNNGEYLQNGQCVSCPKGYENTPVNATSIHECYAIIEGQEITKTQGEATICPKGKYQGKKNVQYGEVALCNDCLGNKTTLSTGSKSIQECDVCIKGYIKNDDGDCVLEQTASVFSLNHNQEEDACYLSSNNLYTYGKYAKDSSFTKLKVSKEKCNKLEIENLSMHDGSILQGAKYVLQKFDNNKVISETEYTIGYEEIKELSPGKYLLIEKNAPTGYTLNSKDTEIKVGLDGTIYVKIENYLQLNGSNGVRNVSISINNTQTVSNNNELKKCFVKNGNGLENEYCYGEQKDCEGYTETSYSSCNETPACYLKGDGSYVTGRYDNQKEYIYYGLKCAACYVNSMGEYYWTNEPDDSEKEVDTSKNEEACVVKQRRCYANSNNERFWGYFDDILGYFRLNDILNEESCLNRTSNSNFTRQIIYIVMAVITAIMVAVLSTKKTNNWKKRGVHKR